MTTCCADKTLITHQSTVGSLTPAPQHLDPAEHDCDERLFSPRWESIQTSSEGVAEVRQCAERYAEARAERTGTAVAPWRMVSHSCRIALEGIDRGTA